MASNAPSRGDNAFEPGPSSGSRRTPAPAPYIVLVGLDLSEPGGRAWRFAFELATLKGEDSEVHAVVVGSRAMAPPTPDVTTPGTTSHHPSDSARPSLRVLQHRSAGGEPRLMAMHFRSGRPDRAIVDLAREIGADVIVVATQPTTRLQRLFGGTVADRITRSAPCPVVVVRPKNDVDDPGIAEFEPHRG
jgi:nucleotide-binding universal stress UspA family protein